MAHAISKILTPTQLDVTEVRVIGADSGADQHQVMSFKPTSISGEV
jgi:hypothetical protein